ncbi:MAG: M56 family metallopeptidase [Acidobacteriaceae bacterium]
MATYAVNALWQVPLIACAGWGASRLLGRLGPRAQHRVWVATLLLSMALPVVAAVAVAVGSIGFPSVGAAPVSLAMGPGAGGAMARGASLVLPGWLLWCVCALYAGAVLYFAGRLAWMALQTRVLVGESVPAALPDTLLMAWERCGPAFGLESIMLRASGRLRGVVTAGTRRTVIVLPEGFVESCTEQEFLSAMGHECAHIRRRDSLKNLLYEAASVVTAFHPVTWMVKAQVAETRELICDAMAVETLVDVQSYTQSLLRLAERMLAPGADPIHAIGMFDANVLEKRIMWMKAKKQSVGRPAQWALTVGAALVLGSVAAAGASMGRGVAAQTASHDGTDQGKVYRPGGDVTNPVLTYAPDPDFPKAEKTSKGGVCVVGLVVDAHGMPQEVHVVRSLKADFDANALAVVRQYRFKPGMRKGQPVAVRINIEVNYRRY